MAVISADRFHFGAKMQRVKLAIDQKIRGVALKAGDVCELLPHEALYLKNIGRVKFMADEPEKPKSATR